MAETGAGRLVWEELQRQLDELGLQVRKGVVQDASFITSDPGHAPADKPSMEPYGIFLHGSIQLSCLNTRGEAT